MKRRRIAAASVAVAILAAIGVYISGRNTSQDEAGRFGPSGSKDGVLNTEQSPSAMKAQPMPQLSRERFEPPPTIATGTYTEPKYRKSDPPKDKSSAR